VEVEETAVDWVDKGAPSSLPLLSSSLCSFRRNIELRAEDLLRLWLREGIVRFHDGFNVGRSESGLQSNCLTVQK
jgi:hypothetical protein